MNGKRRFLRVCCAAAAATIASRAGFAHAEDPHPGELAHASPRHLDGDAGHDIDVSLPPQGGRTPFGIAYAPYRTPERMAEKIGLIHEMPEVTRHWKATARMFRSLGRYEQLVGVNDFVNKVPYITDSKHFGVNDRWEDPAHFFGHGGDCEEFALAKMALLGHLGFHPDRLQMIALLRLADHYGHAVLTVNMDDRVYVLDQLKKKVMPDVDYRGFRVVYSICARGVHVPTSGGV